MISASRSSSVLLVSLLAGAVGLALAACSSSDGNGGGAATSSSTSAGASGTDGGGLVPTARAAGFFTIGGTVEGLEGKGLVLAVNGVASLAVGSNGRFTLPKAFADGTAYSVLVTAQPTAPAQTCTVTNGVGTVSGGEVEAVRVSCARDDVAIRGRLRGLVAGAVKVKLGDEELTLSTNDAFAFAGRLAQGGSYAVRISKQPPGQTCEVNRGTGTVDRADITDVDVVCPTQSCLGAGHASDAALVCPLDLTVASIDEVAYGLPNPSATGSCTSTLFSCTGARTRSAVETACLGKPDCAVHVDNATLGSGDSFCDNFDSSLFVLYTCR